MQASQLALRMKTLLFEENKGQLRDENHRVLTDVKYYGNEGGVKVYCKSNMVSFVFTKIENEPDQYSEANGTPKQTQNFTSLPERIKLQRTSKISTSRMDLVLIGSNPNVNILATDQQEYYENFYITGDANHGIKNVHTYKTITYKNIYSHIDMLLKCGKGNSMEYSFLIHPGGKVSSIKLKWNSVKKEEIMSNGGIRYTNTLGSIIQSAPRSYANGKLIVSKCKMTKSNFGFLVGNYNKSKTLLIDPDLLWATYFGGEELETATSVCTDTSGNVYIVGATVSNSGIATSGAYQTSHSGISPGTSDAFLAKFNSTGTLAWATYYGGENYDGANGALTDASSNVYICGITSSIDGIATSGSYQSSNGGQNDAFLAKFSADGSLTWATYYGGNNDDNASSICKNKNGDIFITGVTSSTNSIASNGAYQTSYQDSTDAFLAKFSNSGVLLWATYYGGLGKDAASSLTTDLSDNCYIAGSTTSLSGIATSGSFKSSSAISDANSDGFLAKFTNTGALSWATYFGGNALDDIYGVGTDPSGNVYIAGNTLSSTGLATSGAYLTSYVGGGQYDAFLAKFTTTGKELWSTYYGGPNGADAYGINTDPSGAIFIVGSTSSKSGIATSGAYQTSNSGGDAFLSKFDSTGTLTYGTYFAGGNGTAVTNDGKGNVYIVGNTLNTTGVATSGAYQTSFGGVLDAYLAKFSIGSSGINPDINSEILGLVIYPNPFINNTMIKFNLPKGANVNLKIIDMMGKDVYQVPYTKLSPGSNQVEFNASDIGLVQGTYFLNITCNDQLINRKIIEVK